MASVQDILNGFVLPQITFNTAAFSSSVASAGQLTGSPIVVLNNSGATPGTLTTRTAALMIGDGPLFLNQVWWVLLVNGQATGTLTLAGGSGVTVSGTATVLANTARLFVCTVTAVSTPAITMNGLGISVTATAFAFAV